MKNFNKITKGIILCIAIFCFLCVGKAFSQNNETRSLSIVPLGVRSAINAYSSDMFFPENDLSELKIVYKKEGNDSLFMAIVRTTNASLVRNVELRVEAEINDGDTEKIVLKGFYEESIFYIREIKIELFERKF